MNEAMASYRLLNDWERQIILRLLSGSLFPGRDDLLAQVEQASACPIDEDGSISLKPSIALKAAVTTRIPVEGEAQDADGMTIHYLLHVVDGQMNELEVYKDDSSRVLRRPVPEEVTVMNAC